MFVVAIKDSKALVVVTGDSIELTAVTKGNMALEKFDFEETNSHLALLTLN